MALSASVFLPILLQLTGALGYLDAFALSVAVVLVIPYACGFFWSQVIKRKGVLSHDIHAEKSNGLKATAQECFSDLWIIPSQSPLPVSDAKWMASLKRYGQTGRAALVASTDTDFFVVGAISLIGFYVGFAADFGISLTRLATATGAAAAIQLVLIVLTALVSTIYFFNGFFRAFLLKDDK